MWLNLSKYRVRRIILFLLKRGPRFFFFFKKSTQKSVFFLVLVATCITKEGQPGYKTMQHCGNARYITHRNYTIYSKYKHRTNKLHLNFYLRWLFSSKLRTIWNEENSWNINGTRDTGFRLQRQYFSILWDNFRACIHREHDTWNFSSTCHSAKR